MSEANKKKLEELCKEYSPHFKAEEFKCECNGKYCDGYPVVLDKNVLIGAELVRKKGGNKPMQVTSGLRCQKHNDSLTGSIKNSPHTKGLAMDFNIKPYTWDKNNRYTLMSYIKTLPNYNYTYGNTPNMGVAIHMDFKKSALPLPKPVNRNPKIDQFQVISKTVNCRTTEGLYATVVGLTPTGYYNLVKKETANNYTWLFMENDRCCAYLEKDVVLLPKEDIDYKKKYEEELVKNENLMDKNEQLLDKNEDLIDENKELANENSELKGNTEKAIEILTNK